jgi:hypothetical protein
MEQTEPPMIADPGPGALRNTKKPLLLAIITIVSVMYFLALAHYGQVRRIDGDEGFYSSAARLVWEGKAPYRDFVYNQAPLLPYLYSWVWAVHPRSLESMRILSAFCGGIAVFLWGAFLVSVNNLPTEVALATFGAVLLNPSWVAWHSTLRTHAFADLLISIVMICFYFGLHSKQARWFFFGGAALGACASIRGLYGPLIPFVLAWLLYNECRASKLRFRKSQAFLAGGVCGLLPMLISFAAGPSAFLFNNAEYRLLLSGPVTLRHRIHDYLTIAFRLTHQFYFVLGVLLAALGTFSLLRLRKEQERLYTHEDYLYFGLTFLMLLVYVATAMVPVPLFGQYFDAPLVPFLVPFFAEGLRVTFLNGKRPAVLALAVLLPILSIREARAEVLDYSPTPQLRLSSFRQVTQVIEANSSPESVVLSIWPGYVFQSGRRYFPGSENHFNYAIAVRMSPEERARYHLLSKYEVKNAVSARTPDLLITYPNIFIFDTTMSADELHAFYSAVDANYSLIAKIDLVGIYRRR